MRERGFKTGKVVERTGEVGVVSQRQFRPLQTSGSLAISLANCIESYWLVSFVSHPVANGSDSGSLDRIIGGVGFVKA